MQLSDRVVDLSKLYPAASIYKSFGDRRVTSGARIGVGDTVRVTIWEASGGGLFSPQTSLPTSGAPSTAIPEQVVGRDGTINVPFANRVRVLGMTPRSVEQTVTNALAGKAIEPSVLVTVRQGASRSVTVTGDGTAGARLPITENGDRILDVIAAAGGLKIPSYSAAVRLTRGSRTISVPFGALLQHPRENIYVQPNDVLTVVSQPRSYTVLGATGVNSYINFDSDNVMLVGAVSKAGGLNDQRADPNGVFLFRSEPVEFARRLANGAALPAPIGGRIPVVYQVNLRDPRAYLLAQNFSMVDRDIIYVANADAAQLLKFTQLIGSVLAPAASTAGTTVSIATAGNN